MQQTLQGRSCCCLSVWSNFDLPFLRWPVPFWRHWTCCFDLVCTRACACCRESPLTIERDLHTSVLSTHAPFEKFSSVICSLDGCWCPRHSVGWRNSRWSSADAVSHGLSQTFGGPDHHALQHSGNICKPKGAWSALLKGKQHAAGWVNTGIGPSWNGWASVQ